MSLLRQEVLSGYSLLHTHTHTHTHMHAHARTHTHTHTHTTPTHTHTHTTTTTTTKTQAVDVVGQAGKPKSITGFQTHTTPVLLAYGERAELATEECILTRLIDVLLLIPQQLWRAVYIL